MRQLDAQPLGLTLKLRTIDRFSLIANGGVEVRGERFRHGVTRLGEVSFLIGICVAGRFEDRQREDQDDNPDSDDDKGDSD